MNVGETKRRHARDDLRRAGGFLEACAFMDLSVRRVQDLVRWWLSALQKVLESAKFHTSSQNDMITVTVPASILTSFDFRQA